MHLQDKCDMIKGYKIVAKCKENCHQARKIEIPETLKTYFPYI